MVSIPADLSDSPEDCQAVEPVTLPMRPWWCQLISHLLHAEWRMGLTSTAPLTYWAWPPMRLGASSEVVLVLVLDMLCDVVVTGRRSELVAFT